MLILESLPKSLSSEEISNLFVEFKSGSKAARDKLVYHNLRLVDSCVSKYFDYFSDDDKQDLLSVGYIGLIRAVDSYDNEKGFSFATYAFRCIINEICSDLKKRKKREILSLCAIAEFEFSDNGGIAISNFLNDMLDDFDLQTYCEDKELIEIIYKSFNILNDSEKKAIYLYFGFDGSDFHSMNEIGKELHVTRDTVSRIIKRALKKIINNLNSRDSLRFFDGDIRTIVAEDSKILKLRSKLV